MFETTFKCFWIMSLVQEEQLIQKVKMPLALASLLSTTVKVCIRWQLTRIAPWRFCEQKIRLSPLPAPCQGCSGV